MGDFKHWMMVPPCGKELDPVAGIDTWIQSGGTFFSNLASPLVRVLYDRAGVPEEVTGPDQRFEPGDLRTLRSILATGAVQLSLRAPPFPYTVQVAFHREVGLSPVCFAFDDLFSTPERNPRPAEAILLSFARACGAGYIVAYAALDYSVVFERFARDGDRYHLALSPPYKSGKMRNLGFFWVAVRADMPEMRYFEDLGFRREELPMGYTRFLIPKL